MQALFKARFEQALESQKLNIKKIEQQLRRMGVNPEDPTAMASIQRVASTFFNAIDKKEGSPYVFREDKQSIIESTEGLEELEPSVDSDQEELDRFIAEIEDAADKEYEVEEAKENEEIGRLRYWNREEYGGRFRRLDSSRNDDYGGEVRGSRVWQTTHSKHRATDSDDEEIAHSDIDDDDDDDDEFNSSIFVDDSDIDSNSNEARGGFKESGGRGERRNISPNRHTEAKFRRNMAIADSELEGMLSDVENAMWDSDEEENDSGNLKRASSDTRHLRRANGGNYKSSSSDDEHAYQLNRSKKNGMRDHKGKFDGPTEYHNSSNAPESVRGRQEGFGRTDSESVFSDSEKWMWDSDAEEDSAVSRADRKSQNSNVVKSDSDIHKRRSQKEEDEAWDSD